MSHVSEVVKTLTVNLVALVVVTNLLHVAQCSISAEPKAPVLCFPLQRTVENKIACSSSMSEVKDFLPRLMSLESDICWLSDNVSIADEEQHVASSSPAPTTLDPELDAFSESWPNSSETTSIHMSLVQWDLEPICCMIACDFGEAQKFRNTSPPHFVVKMPFGVCDVPANEHMVRLVKSVTRAESHSEEEGTWIIHLQWLTVWGAKLEEIPMRMDCLSDPQTHQSILKTNKDQDDNGKTSFSAYRCLEGPIGQSIFSAFGVICIVCFIIWHQYMKMQRIELMKKLWQKRHLITISLPEERRTASFKSAGFTVNQLKMFQNFVQQKKVQQISADTVYIYQPTYSVESYPTII